jgi:ribosomal-protein-serine acetyltransferase
MSTLPVAEDLWLRAPELSDAPELFALTDTNRSHLRTWLPWLDKTQTVAATEGFIRFTQAEAANGRGWHLAVIEQGQMVGMCGYNRIEPENRLAHIGYWLAERASGRGVMSRAVAALVAHGFAERKLHRQVICCATGNARSATVAERNGFRFEGIAREAEWLYDRYVDHRVYARLRGDS